MQKTIVDIGWGDVDIYVDGKLVLYIGQVSDEDTINLFLHPQGNGEIMESLLHEENPEDECTHELLMSRQT